MAMGGTAKQKWEMVPVAAERELRRRAKAQALASAYEVVNKRDGNQCRVTGVPLAPSGAAKHRREHHHLLGRNVAPALREAPENIILVSALVHDYLTRGWIGVEGTDARKALRFHWSPDVPAHLRLFRIKSRRRSQQRER